MRTCTRTVAVAAWAMLSTWTSTWASAQPLSQPNSPTLEVHAGTGWGRLWDDETNLGTGVPVSGGVATTLAGRLRIGADVDWLSHTRNSGYLRADGDALGAFGRVSYLFGTPRARTRAYAGGGFGVLRSTGTLTFSSGLVGPGGQPAPGSVTSTPWSATQAAYDIHGGVRVALSPRLALRPEYRWRASLGSGAGRGIEPPFIGMQAVIQVDLRLR